MPKGNAYDATCPTRIVLDRIADKWTVLIIGLLVQQPMRFNQLRKSIEGLSQKVLTQTLRTLEADGMVTRTVIPTVPVTVEYAVTPLGRNLGKVLDSVRVWAEDNFGAIKAARSVMTPFGELQSFAGDRATGEYCPKSASCSRVLFDPRYRLRHRDLCCGPCFVLAAWASFARASPKVFAKA
jgi:DNA-binding HxlR family transcriptional regulator